MPQRQPRRLIGGEQAGDRIGHTILQRLGVGLGLIDQELVFFEQIRGWGHRAADTGRVAHIQFASALLLEADVGKGYARFFNGVSIFILAMCTLVMADNLLLLYLGSVSICDSPRRSRIQTHKLGEHQAFQ